MLKQPENLAKTGEGTEEVEEVLATMTKDIKLREEVEKMAEEEKWVLDQGLGSFQRRMLVAVTCKADSLLVYANTIAMPASSTSSSWLQQLALTLYTRWAAISHRDPKFFTKLFTKLFSSCHQVGGSQRLLPTPRRDRYLGSHGAGGPRHN